jgi:phage FluMu protein gp41
LDNIEVSSSSAPLVFIKLVGLTTADAMRLMQSAQGMDETVRWRLAPVGVQADAYVVHARSVTHVTSPAAFSDSTPTPQHSGVAAAPLFAVDSTGCHKNRPVCVLGSNQQTSDADALEPAALAFPQVQQELQKGLEHLASQLIRLRMLYILGRTAWEQRHKWKTHRLHLTHQARLVAAIEPHSWRAHLLDASTVYELDNAVVLTVPKSSGFSGPGFDALPLETALWEFAKRCPEALLSKMVPTAYLQAPLTHRRIPKLSERDLGDHCAAILRTLDTQSRTADDLQKILRLSQPALLRAVASLALTRAIHPEPRAQSMFGWLTLGVRRRVFGPSGWVN